MSDFEPFHSAVNRIPVLRRSGERLADAGRLPRDLFADFAAPGHDHLGADRLSGSIDLEMTVRTPLVFGEQECGSVELPSDAAGRPVVPPTMVKGMVSRAYEAFTCSRFRVFGEHSRQLTYRADAANALRLIPARVVEMNEDGSLLIELLRGDTTVNCPLYNDEISDRVYPVMLAASLQDGGKGHASFAPGFDMKRLRAMTRHERQIHCDVILCLHGDRNKGARYAYWQVTHLYGSNGEPLRVFNIKEDVRTVRSRKRVTGYVYRTAADGDTASQVFETKHDERVFFDISEEPERIPVDPRVADSYKRVVESYSEQRKEKALQNGKRPNRFTGVDPDGLLHVGSLVYALLSEDETRVMEIVPTMVGRRSYSTSPHDLAAEQRVLPVARATEASAADRLFGYVVPEPDEGAVGGDVASRGRLSFGAVNASDACVCQGGKGKEGGPKLAPLLSPKPSSARRFLTDFSGATPSLSENEKTTKGGSRFLPRSGYFAEGQLLGAAAYPVHRRIVQGCDVDQFGFPKDATKAPVIKGEEQNNDAVRLRVCSWMKEGSVLRCTMSFSNLSEDELAALIWVLTPENLVPSQERESSPGAVGFLRMGLGKPLGLGALEVRIADGGLRVIRGKDLSAAYEELSGCLSESGSPVDPSEYSFPKEIADVLESEPWIQALQRAAFGYSDDKPVRYMSLEENKANNQTDSKTGRPKDGRGRSPQDLHGDGSNKPMEVAPDERRNPHTRGPRYRQRR